jgi:hypothetical protein
MYPERSEGVNERFQKRFGTFQNFTKRSHKLTLGVKDSKSYWTYLWKESLSEIANLSWLYSIC